MREMVVGKTRIAYLLKESDKAKLKRIIIKPDSVEVIVPRGTAEEKIKIFLDKYKNNVFMKQHELQHAAGNIEIEAPVEYATGEKIVHYGRRIGIVVTQSKIEDVTIRLKHKLYIEVPFHFTGNHALIEKAIIDWQQKTILEDALLFVEHYSSLLNLHPKAIRIKSQKHLWASCGKDQIINVNWKLIMFPKPVLEYVIVHELCHLQFRNHSASFWQLVGSVFQGWKKQKVFLENCKSNL